MIISSTDDTPPALPPKRDRRPINPPTKIQCNQSRNNGSVSSALSSVSSNQTKQDKDNEERIQLIVDDINQIVEKYTRELDDALRTKTKVRSSSIDHLLESKDASTLASVYHNSLDTLYETNVSKITKSIITKTTINNGQGMIDRKESCQVFNETDCSIYSQNGDFKTKKFILINRQKSNDDEPKDTVITTHVNQFNIPDDDRITNDPPPLPPKRKTGLYPKKNHKFIFYAF